MAEVPMTTRLTIASMLLEGLTQDHIVEATGSSKGLVNKVAQELRVGKLPVPADIAEQADALRATAVAIRRHNVTPVEAVVGIACFARMRRTGLDTAEWDTWLRRAESLASSTELGLARFVECAIAVARLEEGTGVEMQEVQQYLGGLQEQVDELRRSTAEFETRKGELDRTKHDIVARQAQLVEADAQRKARSAEVEKLNEGVQRGRERVAQLEHRERLLTARIDELERQEARAEHRHAQRQALADQFEGLGMPIQSLRALEARLEDVAERHSIPPRDLRKRLFDELAALDLGMTLRSKITEARAELKATERDVSDTKRRRDGLHGEVDELESATARAEGQLVALIERLPEFIGKLETSALNAMRQAGKTTTRQLGEATSTMLAAVAEGAEVFAEVKSNKWVSDALGLLRGEEIPPERMLVFARAFLPMVHRGLKRAGAGYTVDAGLESAIGGLAR